MERTSPAKDTNKKKLKLQAEVLLSLFTWSSKVLCRISVLKADRRQRNKVLCIDNCQTGEFSVQNVSTKKHQTPMELMCFLVNQIERAL